MKTPKKPTDAVAQGDQSFDERSSYLRNNIYGSGKGHLRLKILQRDLSDLMVDVEPLSVLDAGCGSGQMSEWALLQGHHVTACDSAEVMLSDMKNHIQQQVGADANLTMLHSTIQALPDDVQYDVIFCHAVLEWIDEKSTVFDKLERLLKPGGTLSLMFYNAWAREMAQLVYGNFDYIDRNYAVRKRVKMSPHYPEAPDVVEQALASRGLTVNTRSGIRVFYDIMRDASHHETLSDDIIRHELRVSQQFPYWQMGRYVHFIARKI